MFTIQRYNRAIAAEIEVSLREYQFTDASEAQARTKLEAYAEECVDAEDRKLFAELVEEAIAAARAGEVL